MIIVHATWNDTPAAVWFWAESIHNAPRPAGKPSRKKGAKRGSVVSNDDDLADLHPFSAPGSQLRSAINEMFGNRVATYLDIHKKRAWLPSFDREPACSLMFHEPGDALESQIRPDDEADFQGFDPVERPAPPRKGRRGRKPRTGKPTPEPDNQPGDPDQVPAKARTLQPWAVEVVVLPAMQVLDAWMGFEDSPSTDIMLGPSFRFWNEIAKLAQGLIVQESFFPSVVHESGGQDAWHSRWNAVLAPAQAKLVEDLAACMPPSCKTFQSPSGGLNTDSRREILDFLNATIDGYIRLAFQRTPDRILQSSPSNKRPRKASGVAKHWIDALMSTQDLFEGQEVYLQEFSAGYREWATPVVASHASATFRTCFKISPDDDDTGSIAAPDWVMTFHLQALEDPSLLVPAEAVWKERSRVLKHLDYRFENPQERLLEDLGRASKLYPAIEQSLESAKPVDLHLPVQDAISFLHEVAPLFEQEGFGVVVPNWWKKLTARLGLAVTIKAKPAPVVGSGVFGLDSIVQYDWQISLGDQVISPEEFEALVNLKMPVLKFRGEWIELNRGDMEKLRTFLDKGGAAGNGAGMATTGEMTLGDAMKVSLGLDALGTGPDVPINTITTDNAIGGMLDALKRADAITPVPVPTGFAGTLRPYQVTGLSWMAFLRRFGFGACLADDMGLGKTIEVIALLLHEKETIGSTEEGTPIHTSAGAPRSKARKGRAKKKDDIVGTRATTLLICPMTVVGNWVRELAKFGPSLSVLVHYGATRETGEAFWQEAKARDITITTYALASRDRDLLAQASWTTIILDEAQNIKNFTTKQAQSIKSLSSTFKLALTGTPIENRLLELWSIMDNLNPGYLGSHDGFHKAFSIPIERYRDQSRRELLQKLVQPFVLRRVKTDKAVISDLPDKIEQGMYCTLTKEQASLYEATVQSMLAEVNSSEGIQRRGQVLAGIMKLKQICNHPAQFLHDGSQVEGRSGKLARLLELLDNIIAAGGKAIIFTQFKEMGGMLRDYLEPKLKVEIPFLHGETPKARRDAMVQEFQRPGSTAPVFLLSLKAGGTGLNLTAASYVIHFDRWWNPAVENQASDRAFRIGQTKNVQVYKFICAGTLEERIDEMIEQKKALANDIITSGEAMLTELSTDQLRELLALNREAIEED
jgi:SNF2 family DNA or RNA helicase